MIVLNNSHLQDRLTSLTATAGDTLILTSDGTDLTLTGSTGKLSIIAPDDLILGFDGEQLELKQETHSLDFLMIEAPATDVTPILVGNRTGLGSVGIGSPDDANLQIRGNSSGETGMMLLTFPFEAKYTALMQFTGTVDTDSSAGFRALSMNATHTGTANAGLVYGAYTNNNTDGTARRSLYSMSLYPGYQATSSFGNFANMKGIAALGDDLGGSIIYQLASNGELIEKMWGLLIGTTGTPTSVSGYIGLALTAPPSNTIDGAGIYSEGDITVNEDTKVIFDSTAAFSVATLTIPNVNTYVGGDTYMVYDSAGSTLDCFVDATEVWNANTSRFATLNGRILSVSRYTTTQTLGATDHQVACDTDGGAFTVTLPAGVAGTEYRIANTGTSNNALTVAPNGAELLLGANSNFILFDGEALNIVYEATEGWV